MIPKWVSATYNAKRGLRPTTGGRQAFTAQLQKASFPFYLLWISKCIYIFPFIITIYHLLSTIFCSIRELSCNLISFSNKISFTYIVDFFYYQDLMLIQDW